MAEVHGVVLLSAVPFLVGLYPLEGPVLLAVGPVLFREAPVLVDRVPVALSPLEGPVLVVRAEAVPEMRKSVTFG